MGIFAKHYRENTIMCYNTYVKEMYYKGIMYLGRATHVYNVNTKRIDEALEYMKNVLEIVKPLTTLSLEEFVQDSIVILAAERAVHIAMEAIVDVGNHLIDGFIMRDPGSYEDIIEILRDETVLPDTDAAILKEFVLYRKILVHDYTKNNPELLYKHMTAAFSTILNFESHVQAYIKKEM